VVKRRHAPIALMIVEVASQAVETGHVGSSKTVPIVPRTAGPANLLAATMSARPMKIASRAQRIAVSVSPISSAGMETVVLGNRAVAAQRTVVHARTHAEMEHVLGEKTVKLVPRTVANVPDHLTWTKTAFRIAKTIARRFQTRTSPTWMETTKGTSAIAIWMEIR